LGASQHVFACSYENFNFFSKGHFGNFALQTLYRKLGQILGRHCMFLHTIFAFARPCKNIKFIEKGILVIFILTPNEPTYNSFWGLTVCFFFPVQKP
jgi:hypothetical protein